MISCELWSKNEAEWTQTLLTYSEYSIFQAFEWGEFKKNRNWKPLRYHFLNENGETIVLARLFIEVLKKYFNGKGGKFRESTADEGIWVFWLLKHLLRYERSNDEELKERILQNIELLRGHQLIRWMILFIQKSRFLKIFSSLHKSS